MNTQESSRRLVLLSSSTFVHCFCCLRNKDMKSTIVAACCATVMALGTLVRGCSHPAGSGYQDSRVWGLLSVPQNDRVLLQWEELCGKHSSQRARFHPTVLRNAGTSLHGSGLAVTCKCQCLKLENMHARTEDSEDFLFSKIHHCVMTRLVLQGATLFSQGNPFTIF